jgi:hypothetical protein
MSARRRAPAETIPPAEISAHNLDTERAVLGAVMQDEAEAAAALAAIRRLGVTAETFYPEAHRVLFRCCCALADAGRPTTLATVVTALREAAELDAAGGEHLVRLVAQDGTVPAMVAGHAEELVRLAVKRDAEQAARLVAEHARNGAGPAALAAEFREAAERLDRATPGRLEPEVQRVGDEFTVTWTARGVALEFQNVRPGSDGVRADVAAMLHGQELDWGALPLASTTARVSRAGKLAKLTPGLPWGEMLDAACATVARLIRAGEPAVVLQPKPRQGEAYLFEPLVPLAGRATVLHADGGSGKSLLAVALGLSGFHCRALPGLSAPARSTRCLYLDWECDQATAEDREHKLAAGLGVSGEGAIVYRRMMVPLLEAAGAIRRDVLTYGIGLVVVDSLQYAVASAGDRGDVSGPYTGLFNALRTLGPDVTALVLAHHSHAGDDKREAHPYGSRFIHNACGSRWELRADREERTDTRSAALLLGLYHRKANDDWLRPPLALRIVFDPDATRITSGDMKDSPALLERAPLWDRAQALLSTGALDVKTVAEHLGVKEDTARKCLDRHAVKLPNTRPVLYGLKSYARA